MIHMGECESVIEIVGEGERDQLSPTKKIIYMSETTKQII